MPIRPSVRLCSFVYVRCDPMVGCLVYSFKCHSLFFIFFITVVVVLVLFTFSLTFLPFPSHPLVLSLLFPFRVLPCLLLAHSTPLLSTLYSFLPSFLPCSLLIHLLTTNTPFHFSSSQGTGNNNHHRTKQQLTCIVHAVLQQRPVQGCSFFFFVTIIVSQSLHLLRTRLGQCVVCSRRHSFPSPSHPIPPLPSLFSLLCFQLLLFPFIDYGCSLDVLTLLFLLCPFFPAPFFFLPRCPWDNSHFVHKKKKAVPK